MTAGLFEDGEFSFLEVLFLVAVPPLISLYSEIRVARIHATATVLASNNEYTEESEV